MKDDKVNHTAIQSRVARQTALVLVFLLWPLALLANPVRDSYILESRMQYSEAYDLMSRLADSQPRHYLAHLRAGWLAYLDGKLSQSTVYYKKAIVIAPDAIEPKLGLMLPQMALGQYSQTEVTGLAVLRTDSKNYTARSRIAYSLFLAGRYRQSVKYYQQLIEDYPSDGSMHLGLAWTLYRMGDKKKALAAFKKADVILPENKSVAEGIQACR